MKKLIFALLILVFLCSCEQNYDILSYQKKDIVANCTVNEKYEILITKKSELTSLEVLSPENMKGITFEFKKDISYAIKDDIKIPLNDENISGIYALSNVFSLEENAISTVSTNNVVSFDFDNASYTVTYGENNLPLRIDISGDGYEYKVYVNSIEFLN